MNSPAKMDVSHMDLFYGDYQALTDINISFAEHRVTATTALGAANQRFLNPSIA